MTGPENHDRPRGEELFPGLRTRTAGELGLCGPVRSDGIPWRWPDGELVVLPEEEQ